MQLQDFLKSAITPVAFKVEGVDGDLLCKPLTMDQISKIVKESEAGDALAFSSNLLAVSVVTPTGEPQFSVADWRNWPRQYSDTFNAIVRSVQQINGMLTPAEGKELGKGSSSTPDSA